MHKFAAAILALFLASSAHAADSSVSNLPAASALDGSELFLGVQGGASKKISGSQVRAYATNSAPYVGVTATRGRVAYGTLGANSWTMSQTMHWARDTMVNPTVIFGNFYTNNASGEVTTGVGTLGASICYGTKANCATGANYTLCGASRANATAVGLNTIACPGITIPDNAQFWVRMLQANATGSVFTQISPQSLPDQDASPDCWTSGTGTSTDMLTSGTYAANQCGAYTVFPLGIAAPTVRPTVILIGDSKIQGGVDYATDVSGDIGNVARSIGPSFGYSNLGMGASLAAQYIANARTYRDSFINTYFSHYITNYCINDLATATTAAQCAASRASIAALYPTLVGIGTTTEPSTTSSDNWTTLANQGAPNVKVGAFNQLVRQGITGERFYFDIAYAIDPARQNVWPVSPNPFATALSPVFSGTGSISTATPSILTVTACSPCTLPIGSTIVGTNVPPGAFIAGYGTNVTSLGVCTATCTFTMGTRHAATTASTTITAAGFFASDGLHLTPPANMWLRDTRVVNPAVIQR
jgi:hypothetical protein